MLSIIAPKTSSMNVVDLIRRKLAVLSCNHLLEKGLEFESGPSS